MAIGKASPKVGKVVDIPANAPTIGTATAGVGSASVAFTADSASVGGPVFSYTVLSNPGSFTTTGTASPLTVSGLTAGTAYTFTVAGVNPTGSSPYSAASNSATILASAFESIATVTAAGGETSLTFSSIAATYKHLQIRGLYRDTTTTSPQAAPLYLRCNTDGATFYASHNLNGVNSAVTAAGSATQSWMQVPYAGVGAWNTAGMYGVSIIDILDYSSTTKYKTIRSFVGSDTNAATTGAGVSLSSGLLMNTAAFDQVIIFAGNTAFAAGSTFALYGIKG